MTVPMSISFLASLLFTGKMIPSFAFASASSLVTDSSLMLMNYNSWPDNSTQEAGFIHIPGIYRDQVHYFYWFFYSQSEPATDPSIFYLAGGPGCSSLLPAMYENGPYRLDPLGSLSINHHSWNTFANLIYVDQPPGTGYSYSDSMFNMAHTEQEVGLYFYNFLLGFFKRYPELQFLDVYIAGDSFAGHSIPKICNYITQQNKDNKSVFDIMIPLRGAMIGGGWTNPSLQYASYIDWAYENGLIASLSITEFLRVYHYSCRTLIGLGEWEAALADCNIILWYIMRLNPGVNVLDIRDSGCNDSVSGCMDYSSADPFFAKKSVRQALNVGYRTWTGCTSLVKTYMSPEIITNTAIHLPELLDSSRFKLLVYTGEYDLIANSIGLENWLDELNWTGKWAWSQTKRSVWMVEGNEAGTVKRTKDITLVTLREAGHLVSRDQPKHTLEMIKRFVLGAPFNGP